MDTAFGLMFGVHRLLDDLKRAYKTHYCEIETPYPTGYEFNGTRNEYTVNTNMNIKGNSICIAERFIRPQVMPSIFDAPKEVVMRETLVTLDYDPETEKVNCKVRNGRILTTASMQETRALILREPVFRSNVQMSLAEELHDHILKHKLLPGFERNEYGRHIRTTYERFGTRITTLFALHQIGDTVQLKEEEFSAYDYNLEIGDGKYKKDVSIQWMPKRNTAGKFVCDIKGSIITDGNVYDFACTIQSANTATRFVTREGVLVEI